MDMHPSGLPHLVGPEGSQFMHTDHSHTFRYMPNNVVNELPPHNAEQLATLRTSPTPLTVRAGPSSPRGAMGPHPLRLRAETTKPGSPRDQLPSSPPPHRLLVPGTIPAAALPRNSPPPLAITLKETAPAVTGTADEVGRFSASED